MKLLKKINEMFADQGSGHAAKDSKSRDGKRKFVVTIKRGDGTEIEKNVKAFSIGDIEHHFGKDFVDAELHPDELVDDDDLDGDEGGEENDEVREGVLLSEPDVPKPPAGLDSAEKFAWRKGFQNPDDTPEDWEFNSKDKQGRAFVLGRMARKKETDVGEAQLTEMAKRSKPEDFYALAKKKYGADKVKALKWPEIVAVAKENDVLIPPYLRSQKVGRGLFNLVPPDHADGKPAPKEEPKAAPKEEPKKEYKMPQLESISYSDWSEFYREMKKRFGEFDLKRVEHGRQTRDRFGTMIGPKLMVDTKTDKVMGVWEVTGSAQVPGRGFVAYGSGQLAKAKQEEPKAAPKPVERRKGGVASEDEMKAALLDAASEMRHHRLGKGADWRSKPEKNGRGFEVETRYWGNWEGDDGSGDYDHQELSRDSSKEVAAILQQVEKRHPKVALSFQTGEKNWLYIRAE